MVLDLSSQFIYHIIETIYYFSYAKNINENKKLENKLTITKN